MKMSNEGDEREQEKMKTKKAHNFSHCGFELDLGGIENVKMVELKRGEDGNY